MHRISAKRNCMNLEVIVELSYQLSGKFYANLASSQVTKGNASQVNDFIALNILCRDEIEADGQNQVDGQKLRPLKPCTFAIIGDHLHDQH